MMTQFLHIRNSILDPPETLVWPYSLYILQQQGSSAATEMEVERLKRECNRTLQMVQQWKKMYENLHEFCVNELLDGDQVDGSKRNVVWEGCSPCTNSFTGLAVLLVVGGMNSRLDPFEGYFLVFICSFFFFLFWVLCYRRYSFCWVWEVFQWCSRPESENLTLFYRLWIDAFYIFSSFRGWRTKLTGQASGFEIGFYLI